MKLTKKQREALKWLAKDRWTASWWGGRPHGHWPEQMPQQTYSSLSRAGFIKTLSGSDPFEKSVLITLTGVAALRDSK